jgi:hypothetical protein
MYEERKLTEILWVGELYGPIEFERQGLSWLQVFQFPLPERRWNKRFSELLLAIPEAYPELPPSQFYLDRDLRDVHGRRPGHFFAENDLSDKGWGWFCFYLDQGWSPSRRIEEGDNLTTVIERIQIGLAGG